MSLKFWKSDREKFEEAMRKALEARKKGDLREASKRFEEAAEIAAKSSDAELKREGEVARAYALTYSAIVSRSPGAFRLAAEAISKLPGDLQLDLGLERPVRAAELAEELGLLSDYLSLPPISGIDDARRAKPEDVSRMEELGKRLISRGNVKFILEDLVNVKEPLNVVGRRLLGLSRLSSAAKLEEDDLDSAIKAYAEASAFLEDSSPQLAAVARRRMESLSKATRCWICGRPVQGEGVNFVYLDTFTSKYLLSKFGNEAPNMVEGSRVAVCKVCYGFIYNLSNEIATHYYNLSLRAIQESEQRIMAMIAALQARVAAVEAAASAFRASRRGGPL
ncbi:MAG: hypothetical protein ABWK00_06135 [Desulfurococcaceae archaeon]